MANLLTASQAAEILNVEITTVTDWARKGVIPSVKLVTGTRRFVAEDLQLWINSHKVGVIEKPTAQEGR